MPNTIGPDGLQIQTLADILDELKNGTPDYPGMFQIYGANINVDPNSPDGQMLAIIAQAKLDALEFIAQVYSSFDPDQAVGTVLDQRCAINGVQRNTGTYTLTNVLVTVSQAVTLLGLDDTDTPFTVADAAGTQFYLVATNVFGGAGNSTLAFRAKQLGAVEISVNTLTTIVTITLGVVSVNNPGAVTAQGIAEESDASLRVRRERSVALPSKGFFDGLYGALLDVIGVTSVNLLENDTDVPANGVPGHSIWVIVAGGVDADIAQAIFVKRNAGCGMKGSVSVNVPQIDGGIFAVLFDRPTTQDLWISFNLTAITGTIDEAYVRSQLLAALFYDIGEPATASEIVRIVQGIAPNAYVSSCGVSTINGSYIEHLTTTGAAYQFVTAAARVVINGTPG